jgi:predicted CoA-binding protein
MPTDRERFWEHSSFAFVGHSAVKGFPATSYREARKLGKKVFAVDPSVAQIEGDATYPDLKALPEPVEAAVLEVPKDETAKWVGLAADAGIDDVWIHMNRDTPEALSLARDRGVNVHTGSCAVMYLVSGFNVHTIHGFINKLVGKY